MDPRESVIGLSTLREQEAKPVVKSEKALQLEAYLKKYTAGGDDSKAKQKKKKKRKREAVLGTGVKLLDEDVQWHAATESSRQEGEIEDEVPVIANLAEAEHEVKLMKKAADYRNSWAAVPTAPSSGRTQHQRDDPAGVARPNRAIKPDSDEDKAAILGAQGTRTRVRHDSDDDASPPRRKSARHDSDDDASPPRRRAARHDSDVDASPPRRRAARHDSDEDASPPRRRAVRRDSDEDASPPRRRARHDSDEDASPPRRRARHDSDEDASPPRRRAGRHDSDEDASPPRRKHAQHGADDAALPPPPRRNASPQSTKGSARDGTKNGEPRLARMADGTSAGVVSAAQLTREQTEKRAREQAALASLSAAELGRGAEARFRVDGKAVSREEFEAHLKAKEDARRRKPKYIEEDTEWKHGVAQKRAADAYAAATQREAAKKFHREFDEDADAELRRELNFAEDPMAKFVASKRQTTGSQLPTSLIHHPELTTSSGFAIPQEIPPHSWLKRGVHPPPNRYRIKPGRHWDGVLRGGKFEEFFFRHMNQRRANAMDAHAMTEDY